MKNNEGRQGGFHSFLAVLKQIFSAIGRFFAAIGRVVHVVVNYIARMHKVFMAIPVLGAAVYLAQLNAKRLPEIVGLGLQETGEYLQVVSRDVAVLGPFAVTAVCLLLMFLSRRAVYPWLISIFSLVLPLVIWVTNLLPG